jgi:hypothetical protein
MGNITGRGRTAAAASGGKNVEGKREETRCRKGVGFLFPSLNTKINLTPFRFFSFFLTPFHPFHLSSLRARTVMILYEKSYDSYCSIREVIAATVVVVTAIKGYGSRIMPCPSHNKWG